MPRLMLALSLASLGAACAGNEPARAPAAPAPIEAAAPLGGAAALPASPPASNADVVTDVAPDTTVRTAAEPSPATDPDPETLATFRRILDGAAGEGVAARPFGEIVQWVGEQLIGRPYTAGLLDAPETETLVVDLRQFDCVLYVENVIALAQTIALGEASYEDYAARVERLRYREGTLGGYCSRLHYFTDWIRDNEGRGAVRNVTREAGGERFDKTLAFMSEHRDSYPKLEDDSAYACIVDMEAGLREVELFYIPQSRIAGAYGALQAGDVIATATSIGGLDVTHTGFVHQTGAGTGFMHASLSSNAVKVSPDLEAYVQGIQSQIGVVVARPVDPRGIEG